MKLPVALDGEPDRPAADLFLEAARVSKNVF